MLHILDAKVEVSSYAREVDSFIALSSKDSINSNTFIIFSFENLPSKERLYLSPSLSSNSIFIFFFGELNTEVLPLVDYIFH